MGVLVGSIHMRHRYPHIVGQFCLFLQPTRSQSFNLVTSNVLTTNLSYHPQIRRQPQFTSSLLLAKENNMMMYCLKFYALGGFPISTVCQHTTEQGCSSTAVYLQLAAACCSEPSENRRHWFPPQSTGLSGGRTVGVRALGGWHLLLQLTCASRTCMSLTPSIWCRVIRPLPVHGQDHLVPHRYSLSTRVKTVSQENTCSEKKVWLYSRFATDTLNALNHKGQGTSRMSRWMVRWSRRLGSKLWARARS